MAFSDPKDQDNRRLRVCAPTPLSPFDRVGWMNVTIIIKKTNQTIIVLMMLFPFSSACVMSGFK